MIPLRPEDREYLEDKIARYLADERVAPDPYTTPAPEMAHDIVSIVLAQLPTPPATVDIQQAVAEAIVQLRQWQSQNGDYMATRDLLVRLRDIRDAESAPGAEGALREALEK